jgi:hypothetical protein
VTAQKLLNIARSQIGTTDCQLQPHEVRALIRRRRAAVVRDVRQLSAARGRHRRLPAYAHALAGVRMFRNARCWFGKPKAGDAVYFNFPHSVHRVQHVGFVEKVNADGSVVTIEGNTSSSNHGSQDNGGVYRRLRPRSSIGFGRPRFGKLENDFGDSGRAGKVLQRLRNGLPESARPPARKDSTRPTPPIVNHREKALRLARQ